VVFLVQHSTEAADLVTVVVRFASRSPRYFLGGGVRGCRPLLLCVGTVQQHPGDEGDAAVGHGGRRLRPGSTVHGQILCRLWRILHAVTAGSAVYARTTTLHQLHLSILTDVEVSTRVFFY